jgi:hypothetical protein
MRRAFARSRAISWVNVRKYDVFREREQEVFGGQASRNHCDAAAMGFA